MKDSTATLTQLGQHVAHHQDAVADAAELGAIRERFLTTAAAAERPSSRRRWLAGGVGLSLAAVAVAAAAFVLMRQPALQFEVGQDRTAGVVGSWIAAQDESLEVSFSDGTSCVLAPQSRARVTHVDESGARVVLESGRAHFEVEHRAGSHWQVDVGPFEVVVTGTAFEVAWQPGSEAFELVLSEGSVVFSGPLVGERRPLKAGQTARAWLADERVEIRATAALHAQAEAAPANPPKSGPPLVAPAEVGSEPPAEPATGQAASGGAAAAPSRPTPTVAPAADWQGLAATGHFKKALAAAQIAGFDGLCDSLSAAELARLADAARLGGDPSRAAIAYQALRRRFPTTAQAPLAAFTLGKMDFDQRQSYSSAARWFSKYLREQPNGALAREAAGRLMEAWQHAGNKGAARTAARDYLKRYPNGPHAQLATTLVQD